MREFDAVVVGAGPNGLAAAIALAEEGLRVMVREGADRAGGGSRSAELTLPGFVHDVCSAVHPLAVASPFLRRLPLRRHGLDWIQPAACLAHPLDDGSAVTLERSIGITADGLALAEDARAWERLFAPIVADWERLVVDALAPLHLPRHPIALARFGLHALRSANGLATSLFRGARARALFAGNAAHGMLPLDRAVTAGFGLVLTAAGHAVGWPFARGGSQAIADAMAAHLRELGGEVSTGVPVRSLDELDGVRTVLLDVTPRQLLRLAGHRLPPRYRRQLDRYRYGLGAYKVDWALDRPIPWRAASCARAGTVHLGGTLEEIAEAEALPWRGRPARRPFVLLAQPTLFDPTRAPDGAHTAWAYCHVPHASTADMLEAVEAQVERFAPGFRRTIVARHVMDTAAMERRNPNLVGGDINGGVQDLGQLFFRPVARWVPYATPLKGVYLCSASTPPGGGVHGLCGWFAARAALARLGG